MNSFARALGSEFLKVKRTLALVTVVFVPLFVVALSLLRVYAIHAVPAARWSQLTRGASNIWGALMLPLLITLLAALLAEYEYRDSHWKQLFALPVPRSGILAAKIAMCVILVVIANVAFWAALLCVGSAFGFLQGQDKAAAIGALSAKLGWILISAFGLLTIQMWISLRWRNFIVATGSGVCAVIGGVLLVRHETAGPIYPWGLPMRAAFSLGNTLNTALWSLTIALVFAVFTCWQMSRRDVL